MKVWFKNLSCPVFSMAHIVSVHHALTAVCAFISAHINCQYTKFRLQLQLLTNKFFMEILYNPIIIAGLSLTILLFSAILHEIAHGYVAERLGDPTARLMGRITLNPKSHIDPMLSLILPIILILSGSPIIIGGAKPVPVDPFNLKEGRKDLALVSLAGPMTNIVIALVASVLYQLINLLFGVPSPLVFLTKELLYITASLNVLLAIFNLIPIPPLDGSKIFSLILSEKTAARFLGIGSMGMMLIFLLLLLPSGLMDLIYSIMRQILNLLGF
jgi:Zn-dependent protease